MVEIIKYQLVLSLIFVALIGCNNREIPVPQKEELPERIDTLENLTVYSVDNQSPDTVELIREQVFESNEEVFFNGYISEIAVDDNDRVYIEAGNMGNIAIYVFESDGSYVRTLGGYGRGPGEFLTITALEVQDNILYVFDSTQQKISGFALDDFSLSFEELIATDELNTKEIAMMKPGFNFFVRSDHTFVLGFMSVNENRRIPLFQFSQDAEASPGNIMELKRYRIYNREMVPSPNNKLLPFTPSFSRSSVIEKSDHDFFYTAWTEDFLIKVYDLKGNYQRAIYYPYENSNLSLSAIDIGDERRKYLSKIGVPDTWPAIHTMEIDDQNRLWVSTITDSDSTFQWWVLDQEGKLMARFGWSGNRSERNVRTKSLIKIQNDYFYMRERDLSEGIDRIVKYRIEFRER